MSRRKLHTCLSPALYEPDQYSAPAVVIIDVLRASSAICTAIANGAASIIPVAGVGEARGYKQKGYLVAAERDGFVLDFADFGNSPFNFTPERVKGNTIVYCTTNGTGIIKLVSGAGPVAVGSFLNLNAVREWIFSQDNDVLLFCAGWKNRFNLEDTVCAGAIAGSLLQSGKFTTGCDSTLAAVDLWSLASPDLAAYIEKAAQRSRLRDKKLDDCLEFCLTVDFTETVPVMKNGVLVDNILIK